MSDQSRELLGMMEFFQVDFDGQAVAPRTARPSAAAAVEAVARPKTAPRQAKVGKKPAGEAWKEF
jgi:hypothetical protein